MQKTHNHLVGWRNEPTWATLMRPRHACLTALISDGKEKKTHYDVLFVFLVGLAPDCRDEERPLRSNNICHAH